ncbi:hypothetical protein BJ138DRAFT_1167205 [Hygrophoropsis aurantiaca]|uniref:Uncharacterized protein n=1 Tax=Hygrophoropsis aurantiaca TaxID=72124 RepID=A0ACB7ZT60_9AGAM|nr:hypothetical protein BJ138DRAFT_1167205 [Hygrophoropsis aurantiaca]
MRRYIIPCGYCPEKIDLVPFVCKEGSKHDGQYCVHCFKEHPNHDGKAFWQFWPLGTAPPGYPMVIPSYGTEAVTSMQSPRDDLTICAVPACSKPTPSKENGPRCRRRMCKSHCIKDGGCETAPKHQLQFASQRYKRIHDRIPDAIPDLDPSMCVEPQIPAPDNEDERFALDLALATAQSLKEVSPSTDTIVYTSGSSSAGCLMSTSASSSSVRLEHMPASTPVVTGSSTSLAPSAASPSLFTRPLSSVGEAKGKKKATPRITTQMSPAWQGIYMSGQAQQSDKLQKENTRIAAELASRRKLDLLFWDKDDEAPEIMALQASVEADSDIPNWPSFALTDNSALLPSLGEDICAIQWFDLDQHLWKAITKLSHKFDIKNARRPLLRRKGVTRCLDLDNLAQRFEGPAMGPHLFHNMKAERASVKDSKAILKKTPSSVIDLTKPSLKRRRVDDSSDSEDRTPPRKRGCIVTEDGTRYFRPSYDDIHVRNAISAGLPITWPLPWSDLSRTPANPRAIPLPASLQDWPKYSSLSGHKSNPAPSSPSSPSSPSESSTPSLPSSRWGSVLQSIPSTSSTVASSFPSSSSLPTWSPIMPAIVTNKKWPNGYYAVDVQQGLTALKSEELKSLPVHQRFEHIFDVPYNKSNLRDARKRWKTASASFRDKLIKAGRTPAGLWDVLREAIKLKVPTHKDSTTTDSNNDDDNDDDDDGTVDIDLTGS